ncbi:MAG: type II toxin-antitoxin system RelE/ParE family toxin [Pyrinomonadaceae bacterium]|nr:type II toxin-antitoxin system RelE/ParE family toxin [Pyrinomonadaceae bacterium]
MTFEVIITPSAKADIFETNAWLLENHPDTAEKWLWQISQCVTSLSKMPERCPVSDESSAFDVEVRHLLCGDKRNVYRILFSIQDKTVYVLRVRATRQKRLTDQI